MPRNENTLRDSRKEEEEEKKDLPEPQEPLVLAVPIASPKQDGGLSDDDAESMRKKILREKLWDLYGKLFRIKKIVAYILDSFPEELVIGHAISWLLSVACDAMRLAIQLIYKSRYGDNPTQQITHYIGGPKAIRFRTGKLILSTLRLIAHVLYSTLGYAFPIVQPILKVALIVFRSLSALWNITDDTSKFVYRIRDELTRMGEKFTPARLFKGPLTSKDKREIGFYSGKIVFFLVSLAAIALSACLGPAAPLALGVLAAVLTISGMVGYTTCSIVQAGVNVAVEIKDQTAAVASKTSA
jgi:hypothetical protein